MDKRETPVSITANRTIHELTIVWGDDHVSHYPFGLLRLACPCASCRGGHENMSAEPDPDWLRHTDFRDELANRMVNLQAVGSYAISFVWEDGHSAGIYNWHYLRALCPCGICLTEKN